jgi:Domain of unknown function (DUF4145)
MKCPHCNTGIAENFSHSPQIFHGAAVTREGQPLSQNEFWAIAFQRCPECLKTVVYLEHSPPLPGNPSQAGKSDFSLLAYPASASPRPVPGAVTDPYKQDFEEACKVLKDSPKASAALSRRCLQAILRDKAGTKSKDLYDQIEEVIDSGKVPSHISDDLHAVRVTGNFGAHPLKSTTTGAIVDVEAGEAEWNLDVVELLFDFYFVQPAISAKRKAALNVKLREAGKPELP